MAVAVRKWVDGLELIMDKGEFDQWVDRVFSVNSARIMNKKLMAWLKEEIQEEITTRDILFHHSTISFSNLRCQIGTSNSPLVISPTRLFFTGMNLKHIDSQSFYRHVFSMCR